MNPPQDLDSAVARQTLLSARAGRCVTIVGGGSIGVSFAIVFARAQWPVVVIDPDADRRSRVLPEVRARLDDLKRFDLLDETPGTLMDRIMVVEDLTLALKDAFFVQECAPERLDLKQALFNDLDRLAPDDAILASVSSAIPASAFASHLSGRGRCLVTHPGNPPYLLPVVEVVPAPFTQPAVVALVDALYNDAGMRPIRVHREVEGFVFNRLQGALLREAYCLVRDGVVSVEDVDVLVREGLGQRWSVVGPFETVDLNTRGGIAVHAQKLGPAYERMGAERGQHDPWTPDLVANVAAQRRALVPLESWDDRVRWRDEELMKRARRRRTMATTEASDDV